MIRPLPPACRLTAIFDCCHSGSVLDLPYMYSTKGKIKEHDRAVEASQGMPQYATIISSIATRNKRKRIEKYVRAIRSCPADVICFSACKDSETSADTFEDGQYTGAMSFAFVSALSQNPDQSYQQLLQNLRRILQEKYNQKPQLSSSHFIHTGVKFLICIHVCVAGVGR